MILPSLGNIRFQADHVREIEGIRVVGLDTAVGEDVRRPQGDEGGGEGWADVAAVIEGFDAGEADVGAVGVEGCSVEDGVALTFGFVGEIWMSG